jgi:hypothetical protein
MVTTESSRAISRVNMEVVANVSEAVSFSIIRGRYECFNRTLYLKKKQEEIEIWRGMGGNMLSRWSGTYRIIPTSKR